MKKLKDAVMQFVQGLAEILKAKPEDIIQIAQLLPDALEVAVLKYQETQGDMTLAAQAFKDYLEKKTKVARHGAKLQYIKNLKNQCADDEEIYYYKKGGSLGCGCKKKEDGGEVTKAEAGWKSKFKNRQQLKKEVEQTYDEKTGKMRPATPAEIALRRKNNQDAYKGKGEGTPQRKKGGELKKNCGGSTLKLKKKGGEICPKCGKIHAAGMGCAVAKFKAARCGTKIKKHELGGSLNGIPFYQKGTPKGGIIEILTEPILKEHDKYYNDYALKSPTSTRESNIAKQYFSSTPTIGNLINGTYHYIKSDPLNLYGLKMGIKQDFRKAKRKDQIKYPILSRLIYGE